MLACRRLLSTAYTGTEEGSMGGWPRRFADHQFGFDGVLAALRIFGIGEFVQGFDCNPAQRITMDVDCGQGGVAVFREPGFVETSD